MDSHQNTIFPHKIFPPQNKHVLCAVPRQTKLLTQTTLSNGTNLVVTALFFKSSTLPKLMVVIRWAYFFCEDSTYIRRPPDTY